MRLQYEGKSWTKCFVRFVVHWTDVVSLFHRVNWRGSVSSLRQWFQVRLVVSRVRRVVFQHFKIFRSGSDAGGNWPLAKAKYLWPKQRENAKIERKLFSLFLDERLPSKFPVTRFVHISVLLIDGISSACLVIRLCRHRRHSWTRFPLRWRKFLYRVVSRHVGKLWLSIRGESLGFLLILSTWDRKTTRTRL